MTTASGGFTPLVTVVDFHHARGPEVENWFGVDEGIDPAIDNEWPLLPFMALSDGAHAATEDFSYFTLRHSGSDDRPASSLFGISCTRQLDASTLIDRPPEVTRSTVQKAVVVIADSPQFFGMLRERLSVVTKAWFTQRDFTDTDIISRFQESLAEEKRREMENEEKEGEEDRDQYLGMSLRELVREFRWQTLVLFKCCLLQPKMLFFGSRCERLCMMQFSLISLIPGLIRNLQDCADPELHNYETNLVKPTSLKTSDRSSLLAYMGLPLQIFGKGSLFGPYTPLQQLDILADYGTKSYIVGSTNSLLLQQKDRYSDILINLDESNISITSTSLRSALALSTADRRWIDFITQSVNETWDESNPGRPKTMGYVGSEEFIRLQFEEYLLSLVSAVKCHTYLAEHSNNPKVMLPQVDGDPSTDFGVEWIEAWAKTDNYRIFQSITDSHIFDVVEPRHPCAGGLTIDDVQRRLAQQVQDFHLDERFAVGKEVLGRNLAAGKEKASTVFNKLYADMEALREAQRKRHEEQKAAAEKDGSTPPPTPGWGPKKEAAGATVTSISTKTSAYLGSWATWAGEKRKAGWGRTVSTPTSPPPLKRADEMGLQIKDLDKEHRRPRSISRSISPNPQLIPREAKASGEHEYRPMTGDSFEESLFDAEVDSEDSEDEHHKEVPAKAPASVSKDGHDVDAAPTHVAAESDEKAHEGEGHEKEHEKKHEKEHEEEPERTEVEKHVLSPEESAIAAEKEAFNI